ERIQRMVQLGAPAGTPGMKTPFFMRLFATPGLNRLMTVGTPDIAMMKQIYRQIGHARSIGDNRIPDAYWRWAVALASHTDTMKNDLRLIERAVSFFGMREHAKISAADLQRLPPVLWVWGESDTFGGRAVLA